MSTSRPAGDSNSAKKRISKALISWLSSMSWNSGQIVAVQEYLLVAIEDIPPHEPASSCLLPRLAPRLLKEAKCRPAKAAPCRSDSSRLRYLAFAYHARKALIIRLTIRTHNCASRYRTVIVTNNTEVGREKLRKRCNEDRPALPQEVMHAYRIDL